MALQAAYKQFLSAPTTSALSAHASLHYITTTTNYHGPADIIKHLGTASKQVKKKTQEYIAVVEGRNSIAAEVETVLEFVTSGGPYLPGLDDNFLVDRTVYLTVVSFPLIPTDMSRTPLLVRRDDASLPANLLSRSQIHIVAFDDQGKIAQVRQSWDQGSLLKQLDVIGKTGRNWPIRDSQDQTRLITKCAKDMTGAAPSAGNDEVAARPRGSSTNILRDPHASLSLFGPREDTENLPAPLVSPYAGNRRPRQRDLSEILGDEPLDGPGTPSRGRLDSSSRAVAPKIGAGKNFQPSRLFEADEETVETDTPVKTKSPERLIKPNPAKYQHFDFADGSEPQDMPRPGVALDKKPKSRHDSQWSFDDFVTPQKPTASRTLHRTQDVRHWGTENDGVEETPAKKVQQVKARRDAEAHFEFQDDGPEGEPGPTRRPRGAAHNTGMGLYENNLYEEDGKAPAPAAAPVLGNITNIKDRRKDFEAHFHITDDSPAIEGNGNGTTGAGDGGSGDSNAHHKISEDRKKAVKMMESNWAAYDDSPASHKENNNPEAGAKKAGDDRGISIAGDGMGGKKGSGRAWAIGDDSDNEHAARAGVKAPGKKQGVAEKSSFWDF